MSSAGSAQNDRVSDSGLGWFLLLACLAGALIVRAMRAPMDGQPDHDVEHEPGEPEVRRAKPAAQPPRPPAEMYARWKIRYRNYEGAGTERVVRVLAVRPRLQRLEVWCELRQAERTLSFWGLEEIVDAETGEIIDFDAWLDAYSASRRAKGRKVVAG